jgi:aquaporin Z
VLRDRRAVPRPEAGVPPASDADLPARQALRRHRAEYAVEAGFVFAFVLIAGSVRAWLAGPAAAVLMGLTITAMIYSPWGRRSGSHLNPALTLAYLRLGKIGRWDALFYTLAQLVGGGVALGLLHEASPPALSSSVGPSDAWAAFATELALSGAALLMILFTSNRAAWLRWTGGLYGLMVVLAAACAAPLSGGVVALGWLNLLAPLLGMALAVEAYRLRTSRSQVLCAKLAHNARGHCIFRCRHPYRTRALAMAAIRRAGDGERP